jgi:Ca2+-binding RTX toxin-like protein
MMRFLSAAALLTLALLASAAPAAATTDPLPTPSCAEGPVRVGETIVGTSCADTIVAPPTVARVVGGGGDDTIVAAPLGISAPCPEGCFLGVGSQTFEGGPGDDVVYGQRGNDTLRGGFGNDKLYGGIGDDLLEGGPGNDLLAGGFGADSIDGQEGDDYVRGDGTIDRIYDSGGGVDTLSYAGGVTPGFGAGIDTEVANFPTGPEGERGVYLNLAAGGQNGDDGIAALGGGVDEVQQGAFERIIGTAYSDYIVGSAAPEVIDGGGGADAIYGEGGDDTILGGADGDYLKGGEGSDTVKGEAGTDNCEGETKTSCAGEAAEVHTRDTAEVSLGLTTSAPGLSQIYLTGSEVGDAIAASYSASAVTFTLSGSSFDQSADAAAGCTVEPTQATCPVSTPLDSIVLAGMAGDDSIEATGFPASTGVVISGGAGDDRPLTGGEASEDVLVDGPGEGEDTLSALGGDDTIFANSADSDAAIDCGEGSGDSALIDIPHPPAYEDPAPIGCETVRNAEPNDFRTQTELPPPPPVTEPTPIVTPPDTKPPRTRITRHPRALLLSSLRRRHVVFAFASNEPGSRFRCRLDRRRYAACTSPRAYTVALGPHTVRVFAIDAAGNADPTPARFDFKVQRRPSRGNH